jgi:hypothetical protein
MRSGASMVFSLLSAMAMLAACASAAAPTAAPTANPSIATPAVTIEPTGTPVATLVPVPSELVGQWRAEFTANDFVLLEIKERAYSIVREASGQGRLELDGDALVFSHGSLCTGEGRYAWTLTGETLHFDSIGRDDCPGRESSLDGATYVRLD